jgi:hypothetical protein
MKMLRLSGCVLLALSAALVACDDDDDPITPDTPTQFTATLDDGNERPNPVTTNTNATGRATFTVNDNGSINYTVWVSNTTSAVTACHIHAGEDDAAGPVIVTLCEPNPTSAAVTTETQIATGTIERGVNSTTKARSPIDLDALLKMIISGDAYVNVHTNTNLPGEVRGQIVAVP